MAVDNRYRSKNGRSKNNAIFIVSTRLVSKTVLNCNYCRFQSNFDISDRYHVVSEDNLPKPSRDPLKELSFETTWYMSRMARICKNYSLIQLSKQDVFLKYEDYSTAIKYIWLGNTDDHQPEMNGFSNWRAFLRMIGNIADRITGRPRLDTIRQQCVTLVILTCATDVQWRDARSGRAVPGHVGLSRTTSGALRKGPIRDRLPGKGRTPVILFFHR